MKGSSNAASLSVVPFGTSLTSWLLPVKLFLFCHPQLAGYNDEVLDVKFLGPGDSHIVVATNSPQLKVFELATSHCQILYGHTGVCAQLGCGWVGGVQVFLYPASFTTLMWRQESLSSLWNGITTGFGVVWRKDILCCLGFADTKFLFLGLSVQSLSVTVRSI